MAKKKAKKKETVVFPDYDLGERLKYLRTSRGFSQAQLARESKVSQPTIAQIESGKKDPSVQTLRQIAQALDVELAAIFAAKDIFVFDLRRLRRKYNNVDKLSPHLYMALGKVVQYAKDIGYLP